MGKFIDLTGQIFRELTVIKKVDSSTYRFAWLCRCVCGNERIISTNDLRRNKRISCGCKRSLDHTTRANNELSGKKFGCWTVIRVDGHIGRKLACLCKCDCGNEKRVDIGSLKDGGSKSCGCLKKEFNRQHSGPNSFSWRGGVKQHDGYILIYKPDYPNSDSQGYVLEHVYVMAQHIGRPLKKGETVHHKNGIKKQNNIENLELWASNHPPGQRVSDLVTWAKEILKEYKPIIE